NLEWEEVNEITPWRFALATAVGAEIPETLLADPEPYYQRVSAIAPMLAPMARAEGADRAAREGILSASAMVDLYSQIYAIEGAEGPAATTAASLREAYVGQPAARLAAIREIWGSSNSPAYGRLVLTAYAAARLRPSEDLTEAAPQLIASMLAAGLDRDAMEWAPVVEQRSQAWALLALAQPDPQDSIGGGPLDTFIDADESAGQRKSRFLVAALAALGRIDGDAAQSYSERVGIDLSRETKWMRMIERAADVDNPALVALLAGLGMQGEGWERMTA